MAPRPGNTNNRLPLGPDASPLTKATATRRPDGGKTARRRAPTGQDSSDFRRRRRRTEDAPSFGAALTHRKASQGDRITVRSATARSATTCVRMDGVNEATRRGAVVGCKLSRAGGVDRTGNERCNSIRVSLSSSLCVSSTPRSTSRRLLVRTETAQTSNISERGSLGRLTGGNANCRRRWQEGGGGCGGGCRVVCFGQRTRCSARRTRLVRLG